MAQSKNKSWARDKAANALSASVKTSYARCTTVKNLSSEGNNVSNNIFSSAFADITQGNLARTWGEYILPHRRENQYIIPRTLFLPPSLSFSLFFTRFVSPSISCAILKETFYFPCTFRVTMRQSLV